MFEQYALKRPGVRSVAGCSGVAGVLGLGVDASCGPVSLTGVAGSSTASIVEAVLSRPSCGAAIT